MREEVKENITNEVAEGSEDDLKPEKKGSKKKDVRPGWVKMNDKEFEEKVVELARKGESLSRIGMIMRDSFGVPSAKLYGVKIGKILKANGIKVPDEREVFSRKIERINSHLTGNKHDYSAKRSLTKTLWVINKLNKKSQGILEK